MFKVELPEKLGVPTDIVTLGEENIFLVATSRGFVLKYKENGAAFVATGKWRPFKKSIRKLAIADDLILAASTTGNIAVIDGTADAEDGFQVLECDEEFGCISALVCGGSKDVYVGNDDGDVFVCTLVEKTTISISKMYDHHDDYISSLQVVSAKKTLIVGSGDGTMSVIDLKKEKMLAVSKNFEEDVTAVLTLGVSGKVLLGTALGALKLFKWNYWGAPCDTLKSKLHSYSSINDAIMLNEELKMIATAGGDGKLRILRATPLSIGIEVLDAQDSLERLAWIKSGDEDGFILAISADDPSVHVVRVTSSLLEEAATSDGACKGESGSDSDSDSTDESDSDEEQPKAKKQKTAKRKPTASGFFKDLD
ncbi:WD40 repeat-like protein [Paramicrosporidium saccamoebae]|uniref:WD repeat-containing protein JIP5 n=1 Tax=Paramicrosporidium saccamoebae TaxID=1246581 RepID=A0A2H9TLV5_9FUNG|nr:WD40 repeat-like protein [Paramicrosporidium saccamoebae]